MAGAPANFTYDWDHELGVAIKTDSLNALLFSFWHSGVLNGPVDLDTLVGDASPIKLSGLSLVTDFYLAPIINECSGEVEPTIQIGDLRLELKGKLFTLDLDAVAFLDVTLDAIFETKEDGFYITLGELQNFDIEVSEVADPTQYNATKTLLEETLSPIIGGLLSGQSFGPIELPSIDLSEGVTGVPAGSVLEFQDLTISQSSGYVLLEGELD
jgi:hypothetical protein